MISIEEAFKAVIQHTHNIASTITAPVAKSGNAVLAADVFSPIKMPPFRQSAMDGYALCLHDDLHYKVVGEVKAGDGYHPVLAPGEAVRIFTGAPVPDTANAIEMQEKVTVNGTHISIEQQPPVEHNIRPAGEQVGKNDLALSEGTILTPAAIGYLSALGIKEVSVYKAPSIAIVTTGDELITPGEPLTYGKIYESNSAMLQSALKGLGFKKVSIHKVDDNYEHTYQTIKGLTDQNDVVIMTGGISVGDYDFVGKALKALEVEQVFYKVKQKPGKPLFFGKKNNTILFALPGNPAASLSCFYLYVHPALQKMTRRDHRLHKVQALSDTHFIKSGDRPQFLKAICDAGRVTILEGQSSAMLQTFAIANALVAVPEELKEIKVNDSVEVILLPVTNSVR
ncbi:molybdopterin molybdotransferase MoeA [Robertkochia sediminum]|uniref:molybdopterin molybdotransferase MoeA n=1 Tax=Robertkochia sediminum TaxID=2785326 RepID=UPI001933553E|nr:gephyrin-like molybdotransferase Glp [Robertkochia sediminum]MBL7471562.1 molybdopterin molybdotransferase MoeA [Robertkochia sediminum]